MIYDYCLKVNMLEKKNRKRKEDQKEQKSITQEGKEGDSRLFCDVQVLPVIPRRLWLCSEGSWVCVLLVEFHPLAALLHILHCAWLLFPLNICSAIKIKGEYYGNLILIEVEPEPCMIMPIPIPQNLLNMKDSLDNYTRGRSLKPKGISKLITCYKMHLSWASRKREIFFFCCKMWKSLEGEFFNEATGSHNFPAKRWPWYLQCTVALRLEQPLVGRRVILWLTALMNLPH